MTTDNVLYTARVRTTGGRDGGVSLSDDGRLDIKHTLPGTSGAGTNSEQLFAAAWSACFDGAMSIVARKMRIKLPSDRTIDAEVNLCLRDGEYFLEARLNINLPGLDHDTVRAVVDAAYRTCPYSKATRGNIEVTINVTEVQLTPQISAVRGVG